MSEPETPPLTGPLGERFRIGRVVARSFAIWTRRLPLLLSLAVVFLVPRVVLSEFLALESSPPPQYEARAREFERDSQLLADRRSLWIAKMLRVASAHALVRSLLANLCVAAVSVAVYALRRGRPEGFAESVLGGFRGLLPALRLSLLALALYAAMALLLWAFVRVTGGWGSAALLLGTPIPALLGALLLSPFWVALPAAVVEKGQGALRRSWRLTRGHRLKVCAMLIPLHVLSWGQLVGMATAGLPWRVRWAAWWAQDIAVDSLAAVLAVVAFCALRLEKEGTTDSDADLKRVFA